MTNTQYRMEIEEALAASDDALFYLQKAKDSLKSAQNWGLWDMFGGGLISTFVKHDKMDMAQADVENARLALDKLSRELDDLDDVMNIDFKLDGFTSFADYFFDDFFSDWYVQSKIGDGLHKIEEAISRVKGVQEKLKHL
ncbi:MAG: hypothetical protein IJZ82_10560 [Lachnospiraceae bacterium]|nr:hypothetical protein [Lachnospiraceae bacterium]